MGEGRKYIKYLVLSLVALAFFFGAGIYLNDQPVLQLSPGEDSATVADEFLGFYVNFSPFITGVLIIATIAFLILIVVESIKHK